jgi:hypothetical protein
MKPLKTAAQIATERPADPAPASLTEKEQLLKALTEARKQLAELQEKKRAVVAQFAASIAGTWKVGDTIHNESVDELNLQINAVKYDEGQIVQVLNERYPLPAVTTPAPEIDSVAWFARQAEAAAREGIPLDQIRRAMRTMLSVPAHAGSNAFRTSPGWVTVNDGRSNQPTNRMTGPGVHRAGGGPLIMEGKP